MRVDDNGNVRVEGVPEWHQNPGGITRTETTHLPDDVVSQPFYLAIEALTKKDNPRRGGMHVALRIGDEDNRPLTDDEKTYIVEQVRGALEMLS